MPTRSSPEAGLAGDELKKTFPLSQTHSSVFGNQMSTGAARFLPLGHKRPGPMRRIG